MTLKERLAQPGMKEGIAKATRKLERNERRRLARQLAPTLEAFVGGDMEAAGWPREQSEIARRELRDLLAVARAARGVFDPNDHDDPALVPPWKRLDRALARLAKRAR